MNDDYINRLMTANQKNRAVKVACKREHGHKKRECKTPWLVFESDYIAAGKGHLLEGYVRL